MSGALTVPQLRAYAAERLSVGRRLLALHRPDDTGLCRRCGRLAPCDQATRGAELVMLFATVAGRAVIAVGPDVRGRVKPLSVTVPARDGGRPGAQDGARPGAWLVRVAVAPARRRTWPCGSGTAR